MDRKHCAGCYNDHYNNSEKNGCWCRESAELVMKKQVHVDDVPPWNHKPKQVPSCYRLPRYVFISPERTC